MDISVWYILPVALCFFVFGAGVTFAIDAHLVMHWRREAKAFEDVLNATQRACREILSDAFYNRVMKRVMAYIEEKAAKGGAL